MKRAWLATFVLLLGITASIIHINPKASALPTGTCGAGSGGSGDACTVLLVQLTGSGIPSSGVTVTAKRINNWSSDNSFTLAGAEFFKAQGVPAQISSGGKPLPANAYTSYSGVPGTAAAGGACKPGGNPLEATFNITVSGAGVSGNLTNVNLCIGKLSEGGAVKTVSIHVSTASHPSKNGTFTGVASYLNPTDQSKGNCDPKDSYVDIWGGPQKISQNNPKQVNVDSSGHYTSPTLPNGSGYSLEIHCFAPGVPNYLYGTTLTNQTLKGPSTKADFKYVLPQAGGQSGGMGTPTKQQKDNPTCDADGDPLTWILCPIFNATANFADWLFSTFVVPFLHTSPISTDPSDATFKIWSSFRIYGNIFLIIALLVIVFGQAIGGGMIDAYTAKKVLPRLLVAAILINLSIYIVAFLVDITNIIGGSIGQVMTAPLQNAGAFHIQPSGIGAGKILGASAAVGIGAILLGFAAKAVLVKALMPILLFVLMPAVFGMLAAFLTLVLRKGIILALVLVSPVAFALYCLPNTEKYFRKWWDFLFQTLMVYPIVIIFFAVADILAVTIVQANGSGSMLALLISFLLQFLPLIFIPYAFRLAGGAVGKAHELITNGHKRLQEGIKGNPNDINSLRNRSKRNFGAAVTRTQAQRYRNLRGTRFGRIGASLYGNAIEKEALLNQAAKQRIFAVKDSGDDAVVNARASFIDTDGKRKTLDGKEVKAADWAASKRLYPNISDIQAVADYRSTKVLSAQEASDFTRNFGLMAQQQGLTPEETTGIFTGLAFARQNERGEFKHGEYVMGNNGQFEFRPVGSAANPQREGSFLDEQYYKRGSFEGSRMFSSYFDSMADIKKRHLDTVTSLTSRQQSGQQLSASEMDQLNESRGRVKQIREIEKAFDIGADTRPGEEGKAEQYASPYLREGLQGASPASQAAFQRLKDVGKGGSVMQQIDEEIRQGNTYETHAAGNRPVQQINRNSPNSGVNNYGN